MELVDIIGLGPIGLNLGGSSPPGHMLKFNVIYIIIIYIFNIKHSLYILY